MYIPPNKYASLGGDDLKVSPLRSGDLIHYRSLFDFLSGEATGFGTEVDRAGFKHFVEAIDDKRVQVLFLLSGWEIAGCAVQFPTVVPQWNENDGKFDFIPAVYSEDMTSKIKGTGTPFMKERINMSAHEGEDGGIDLTGNPVAGALVGEQAWPEKTAIGALLRKFDTKMPLQKGDTVLSLDPAVFAKQPYKPVGTLEAVGLAQEDGNPRADMFAITWRTQETERIAVTFTQAISSFTGNPVVRVHINSHGDLSDDQNMRSGLISILAEGRARIAKLGWVAEFAEPLEHTYIHALGEDKLRETLVGLGAHDRVLGDYCMYPLRMDFNDIPSKIGLDLPKAAPFMRNPLRQLLKTETPSAAGPIAGQPTVL